MRILVIGFGNPSRRDDGVGLAVVNNLRQRLGLPALDEAFSGVDDLGGALDTLFLQQLAPELAETLLDYDRVLFVDAHVGTCPDLIHHDTLEAESPSTLVSHHMKPGRLLALTRLLYGAAPQGELISVRGYDFDFGTTLSPATASGVATVSAEIWQQYHL